MYNKTKLYDTINVESDDVPITHTRVFNKNYPRFPKTPLPNIELDGEFYELLYSRKSVRKFTGKSIELKKIAMILNSCGISNSNRDPEQRTYPSAGARFPIELYLVSFNISGIDPGIYHYDHETKMFRTVTKEKFEKKMNKNFVLLILKILLQF